jgi:hypothetical protein
VQAAVLALKDITTVSLPDASGTPVALSGTDSKADEEFAILLYHLVTGQTGNPASEYPPTDCGSSGFYVCTELEALKLASTYKTGSGVLGALSLLQTGTVMATMALLLWCNRRTRRHLSTTACGSSGDAAMHRSHKRSR